VDQSNFDTNISYFSRHLDKIRKYVALFSLTLIIFGTLPYVIRQMDTGLDSRGITQAVVSGLCLALMVFIYRKGYFLVIGVAIYFADVLLIAAGLLKPDAHFVIAICFFAPPLVSYLFFKPNIAFLTATAAYTSLSFFYLQIFFADGHPNHNYALTLLITQGITNVVGLHLVVSSRHAIEKKLMELAHSDALTGLPNRLHFDSRIEQELERCKREELPLCFAIIDLDFFKRVNDELGHDCGDKVLINVAKVLKTAVRVQDIACRIGGEEFVIIMPNIGLDHALAVLDRIRIAISSTAVSWKRSSISVTASFGCAELNDDNPSADRLFIAADKCLYIAKGNGRNRVVSVRNS